jgi:uncharacterized protein
VKALVLRNKIKLSENIRLNMDIRNFEQAKQYALHRLEHELSPNLLYHGIKHTRDDIVPTVEMLAGKESIQGEPLYLLLTAAWFHDLGFVKQPAYHELISARIASEILPGFGYTEAQVEIIRWIIFATVIPQAPTTILGKIMADADLSVLGRDDFMSCNGNLRHELAFFGKEYSNAEWFTGQLKFLETHTYFTLSAHTLWDTGQLKNIGDLKRFLKEMSPGK